MLQGPVICWELPDAACRGLVEICCFAKYSVSAMFSLINWLDAVIRSPEWERERERVKWTASRARVSTVELFCKGVIAENVFLLLLSWN